jgi:hypothetical protein
MRYSGNIDLQAARGNPVDLDFDAGLTRNFFRIAFSVLDLSEFNA